MDTLNEQLDLYEILKICEDYFTTNFEAFLGGFIGVFLTLMFVTMAAMSCVQNCYVVDEKSGENDGSGVKKVEGEVEKVKSKECSTRKIVDFLEENEEKLKEEENSEKTCVEPEKFESDPPTQKNSKNLAETKSSEAEPETTTTDSKFKVPDHVKLRNVQFREMLAEKKILQDENKILQEKRKNLIRNYLEVLYKQGVKKVSIMSFKVFYPKDVVINQKPVVMFYNKQQKLVYILNLSNTSHMKSVTEDIFKNRVGNTFTKNHLGTFHGVPGGSVDSGEHSAGLKELIKFFEPFEISKGEIELEGRIQMMR